MFSYSTLSTFPDASEVRRLNKPRWGKKRGQFKKDRHRETRTQILLANSTKIFVLKFFQFFCSLLGTSGGNLIKILSLNNDNAKLRYKTESVHCLRNLRLMGSLLFKFIVYIRCRHLITKGPPIICVAKNWQYKDGRLPIQFLTINCYVACDFWSSCF